MYGHIHVYTYHRIWNMASHAVLCMQEAVHGRMVQVQIDGDHYLYQPSVAGHSSAFWPEIGKYFRNGTKDFKLKWKMEHIVHDMNPELAATMVHLPVVCGDRVAFYFRVRWCCMLSQLGCTKVLLCRLPHVHVHVGA